MNHERKRQRTSTAEEMSGNQAVGSGTHGPRPRTPDDTTPKRRHHRKPRPPTPETATLSREETGRHRQTRNQRDQGSRRREGDTGTKGARRDNSVDKLDES